MEAEIKFIKSWANKIWSRSMMPAVCLLLGVGAGALNVEWRILDDCKYSNGFRVGNQSFTCTRKM